MSAITDKLRFVVVNADRWLTGILAGALAKKIILGSIAVFMLSLQVPAISIMFFSIKNGIPAFEAYDAIKDKANIFVSASFIVTLFVAGFFIVPGVVWFNDPALKNLVWSNRDVAEYLHRWTVRRWIFVFVPGIVVALLLASLSHYFESKGEYGSFYGFLFGILCGALIAIVLYFALMAANIRFSKRCGLLVPNPDYNIHKININILLVSFLFSWSYIIVTLQIVVMELQEGRRLFWLKEEEYGLWSAAFLSLFLFLICLTLMLFGSIWANRRSYVWMLGFIIIHFCFLVFVWPGAATLLQGYMRAVRLGGNTPVVITANKSLAINWPEMFEPENQARQDRDVVKSQILLLVLSGNEKLFVRLPKKDGKISAGVLIVKRSDVHHIMYVNVE